MNCKTTLSLLLISMAVTNVVVYGLPPGNKMLKKFVKSGFDFAKNFTRLVEENQKEKNVVCSPTGAHSMLTLVVIGARKNTLKQLRGVLFLDYNRIYFMHGLSRLMEGTEKSFKKVTFLLANKIYVPKESHMKSKYSDLIRNTYLSEISPINGDSSKFVADANEWVSSATNGKINKILNQDGMIQNTGIVLLNAIYFYGDWEQPFNPSYTKEQDFQQFGGNKIKVPMMYNPKIFLNIGIIKNLDAQYIELPYKKPVYRMFIVMPLGETADEAKFEELGRNLKSFDYRTLIRIKGFTKIKLNMPKFTVKSSIDLEPVLKKMGATDMFSSDRADFKLIAENPRGNLKVDKVVQEVFVVVNETISQNFKDISYTNENEKLNLISINKPFYFAIVSPEIVFIEGRVVTPQYEDA